MIELKENQLFDTGRNSSKGNQYKFRVNNAWYKADYMGYEGLSEYIISKLLKFSDLEDNEYVDYSLETIKYNDIVFNGCKSIDFTDGWTLITLERLFKTYYGQSLNQIIYSTDDHEERLQTIVGMTERITGIEGFGIYMNKLMTIDALFLNEDRHTHNIALLTDNADHYKLAPIFDNGAGLMSDYTMDYPLNRDPLTMIDKVKPKTFCDSFLEQLEISEKLYGQHLRFDFKYNDVKKVIANADIYPNEVTTRVTDIIMHMRKTYTYLFT